MSLNGYVVPSVASAVCICFQGIYSNDGVVCRTTLNRNGDFSLKVHLMPSAMMANDTTIT